MQKGQENERRYDYSIFVEVGKQIGACAVILKKQENLKCKQVVREVQKTGDLHQLTTERLRDRR